MRPIKVLASLVPAVALLCASPAFAGSFGFYGSGWDAKEAGTTYGAGARMGFDFVKFLELELHGTKFNNLETTVNGTLINVDATPLDGGLRINFLPQAPFNPYIGAGVSYYFLDSDVGDVENTSGVYGEAGFDAGGKHTRFFAEAMWRKMDTTISFSSFDTDATIDGWSGNVGVTWRWGG